MGRIVYADNNYKILRNNKDYILINKNAEYSNHGHFKKKSTCHLLIRLIKNSRVPDSKYLRNAAIRICNDAKYIGKVKRKIEKDKDKQKYFNSNKGLRV